MRATGKLVAVAAVALGALAAGPVVAQSAWAETPSGADLKPLIPAKSEFRGEAVVHLRCAVADDGRLSQCVVAEERPKGYGLGDWALTLPPKFRATPEAARKMKGSVLIPIRFSMGGEPPMRAAKFQTMSAYRRNGDAGPYYPDRALRAGVTSVVLVDCRVEPTGRLSGCQVADATNREYGFDFAALKMAERGWMTAGPQPEGASPPADGVWRFKVLFEGRRR